MTKFQPLPNLRELPKTEREIRAVSFHHSVSPRDTTIEDIDLWHRNRPDDPFYMVGYHFVIPEDGLVYQGRPMRVKPACVRNKNVGLIGVCMCGNYSIDTPRGDEPQTRNTALLLIKLQYDYQVPILFHRDEAATECPGLNISRTAFDEYLAHAYDHYDAWCRNYEQLYKQLRGDSDG